jgi:nicotinate dehydrogenase subunit A
MTCELTCNRSRYWPIRPLWCLRNDLELNGAKFGCGLNQCGACTVLVAGKAVRSCVTTIGSIGAAQVITIEGLGTIDRPHPIQRAFLEEQAVQCGYCINGMIMTAKALLDVNSRPAEDEVRQALAGNLCRCGTNNRIVYAAQRCALGGFVGKQNRFYSSSRFTAAQLEGAFIRRQ